MFTGSSAQNRSANRCPSSSFAEEHFRKPALSLASAHRELHDMAIPGFGEIAEQLRRSTVHIHSGGRGSGSGVIRSEEHTSELQSLRHLVCRLLLVIKKASTEFAACVI